MSSKHDYVIRRTNDEPFPLQKKQKENFVSRPKKKKIFVDCPYCNITNWISWTEMGTVMSSQASKEQSDLHKQDKNLRKNSKDWLKALTSDHPCDHCGESFRINLSIMREKKYYKGEMIQSTPAPSVR